MIICFVTISCINPKLSTHLTPSFPLGICTSVLYVCFANNIIYTILSRFYLLSQNRNKIRSFVDMWMDVEPVIQTEISQKGKNIIYWPTFLGSYLSKGDLIATSNTISDDLSTNVPINQIFSSFTPLLYKPICLHCNTQHFFVYFFLNMSVIIFLIFNTCYYWWQLSSRIIDHICKIFSCHYILIPFLSNLIQLWIKAIYCLSIKCSSWQSQRVYSVFWIFFFYEVRVLGKSASFLGLINTEDRQVLIFSH